jgi:transglutaminase-like putative cysteine protease
LRLAVLPDWDGVTWHMAADYRSAGRILPPGQLPPGFDPERPNPHPPRTIEQRITVAELRGRLLPAVTWPTRVEGIRVAYDQQNGALLNTTPLTPGTQYTVTSINPSIDLTQLMASAVPHGDEVARYLEVGPAVPPDLVQFAQRIAQGESAPYLRALAVQTFMQEHYAYVADAPSGHAYPNLTFFLLTDPRAGGQQGTSEQFAAAFAVLGRLLGLPTRVVVGFHVAAGGGMVTAADAVAWPEVLFSGIGWVPFDPMPAPDTPARPVEPEFLPPPPASSAPPASVTPSVAVAPPLPPRSRPRAAVGRTGPDAALIASGAGVGVVGLLAVALLVIMVLRVARTRRRLGIGDPAGRVVGAWDEVLDGLMLAGRPPPAHLTAVEVADYAALVAAQVPGRHARRPRPAAPDLTGLARTVNAVVFGGGTVADPDDSAATAARSRAVDFRRILYKRRSWWRRLAWWFDPRPLRRRRRPPA